MPYCAALSFSRTKFTSSIAILSESGGSSSRICRVCTHGLAVERLREEQQPHRARSSRRTIRAACPDRPGRAATCADYDGSGDWGLGGWGLRVSPSVHHVPSRHCLLEQIVERLARAVRRAATSCCWRPCWSGARRSCAARRARRCCARPSARRAPAARRSACTPSGRWCRTTRTARSCADRRRTAGSAHRRRPAATSRLPQRAQRQTSCAAIRFGRLRAGGVLQHAARRALLRRRGADGPFGPRGFAARPDSRAGGTCDRSCCW